MRNVVVQLCLAAIGAAANNILLMRTRNHAFLLLAIALAWKITDCFASHRYLFIKKQTWRSNDKRLFDGLYFWLEDVSWNIGNIRKVKLKFHFFTEKRLHFLMFITAVCFLFLLKLRWPKTKNVYDFKMFCFRQTYPSCFAKRTIKDQLSLSSLCL